MPSHSQPAPPAPSRPRHNEANIGARIFLGVALLLLLGVVASIAYREYQYDRSGRTSNSQSSQSLSSIIPIKPASKDLIAGAFTVGASNNYAIPFTVEQSSYQGLVVGKFTARGGMKNDINVMVMTSDNYINYTNHNQYRVFFESGYVTVGKLKVSLAPGSYYLVFDNSGAWISSKAVEAYVEMRYE